MGIKPDSIIPIYPLNEEEREAAIHDSLLGWKIGRQIQPEQRMIFFKQLWRNNLFHTLDNENQSNQDNIILKNFTESLKFPFEGGENFGIESLIGNEHITFAYTGGYLFEGNDSQIEMYLAKNSGVKARPFGDFHDLAAGQFKKDIGVSLSEMKNAERCLFFHTFNTANNQIEYFVLPVETLHHEQTQMRLGERQTNDFLHKYDNQQLINFSKKFSAISYGITRIVISDPSREHSISASIAAEQILPKIIDRADMRLDFDMDPEKALREAMREKILSRAGLRNSFSTKWNSENE